MSRSNPSTDMPNPATRWFEWKGSEGTFNYWDKQAKDRVVIKLPFQFLVLDRLATVRGFNKRTNCGIYANEVRDTTSEPLVVKEHKGPIIAQGVWTAIKERLPKGASFGINLYIAFKEEGKMKIGAIAVAGCALGAWIEFEQANRKAMYEQAVIVRKTKEGTVGGVKFLSPVFELKEASPESCAEATSLDQILQNYLEWYLKKPKKEQAEQPAQAPQEEPPHEQEPEPPPYDDSNDAPF